MATNIYIARKQNTEIQTQIKLGTDDFILLCKTYDQDHWDFENDLEIFGEIANLEMFWSWPNKEVIYCTSIPPTGSSKITSKHDVSSLSVESTHSTKEFKSFSEVSSVPVPEEKKTLTK